MAIEDKYLDVLQNIEFGIIAEYRKDPSLLDADALEAVNSLVRHLDAGRSAGRLGTRAQRIFDSVRDIVDRRMELRAGGVPLITKDEMVKCLRRIASSIKFWTEERGRQGYLTFVAGHMGPVFGAAEDDSEE
jgi:hypothetical protein